MTTNAMKSQQAARQVRPVSRPFNFRLQPAPANVEFAVNAQLHLSMKDAYCADRATD